MVLAASVRIPRAPTYSGAGSLLYTISDTGVSPSSLHLPMCFSYHAFPARRRSFYPIFAMVWAPPLSLATTYGIVLTFFSCRY